MEVLNPSTILKTHASKLKELSTTFTRKAELNIQNQDIDDLVQQTHHGPSLNIAITGATNSGESTTLNYLLGTAQSNSGIFMTGSEAETSLPWSFTLDRTLPLDIIEVSHLCADGTISPRVRFPNIEAYQNYLKETYSRKVINEIKRQQQTFVNPYRQISIYYGLSPNEESSRLYNPLFSMGINLLDLQGLNEPGSDLTFRSLTKPFVLIYCFDYSNAPFTTTEYKQLEIILQTCEPSHIIFVCTQVRDTLKKLHQISEKKSQTELPFDFLALMNTLETLIHEKLRNIHQSYSLYFFEPNSRYEQLSSGAHQIRLKLIELRDSLNLFFHFNKQMTETLFELTTKLKTKLRIYAVREMRNQSFLQTLEESKKEIAEYFESKQLELKLTEKLKGSLTVKLPQKVLELVHQKKDHFMRDSPSQAQLELRLDEWFANVGFQITLVEVLKEEILEFQNTHQDIIQGIFQKALKELQFSEEFTMAPSLFPKLALSVVTTAAAYGFQFATSSIWLGFFAGIALELFGVVAGFGGVIAIVWFGIEQLTQHFGNVDFDDFVGEWLVKMTKKLRDYEVSNLCKSTARLFLNQWERNVNDHLEKVYSESFDINFDELNEYLTKEGFQTSELDTLQINLANLKEELEQSQTNS